MHAPDPKNTPPFFLPLLCCHWASSLCFLFFSLVSFTGLFYRSLFRSCSFLLTFNTYPRSKHHPTILPTSPCSAAGLICSFFGTIYMSLLQVSFIGLFFVFMRLFWHEMPRLVRSCFRSLLLVSFSGLFYRSLFRIHLYFLTCNAYPRSKQHPTLHLILCCRSVHHCLLVYFTSLFHRSLFRIYLSLLTCNAYPRSKQHPTLQLLLCCRSVHHRYNHSQLAIFFQTVTTYVKKALYIRKRALCIRKGVLCIRKRALYIRKKGPINPQKSSTYPQEGPLLPQKSLWYPQKSPTYPIKASIVLPFDLSSTQPVWTGRIPWKSALQSHS